MNVMFVRQLFSQRGGMRIMAAQLRYGMVGGGPDSMVGPLHRKAIALDGSAVLAAYELQGGRSGSRLVA